MRISSCTSSQRLTRSGAGPIGGHQPGRRRWVAVCASAAGVALIATGCSSSAGSSAGGAAPQSSSASAAKPAATGRLLSVADSALGSMLVDAAGKAVYVFAIDKSGHSVCTGTCLQYWPIVPAPSPLPSALPGITAQLGTLARTDGPAQLTVNGFPVYTFAGDTAPGTTKGQGKNLSGGLWWVVAPSGTWITAPAPGGSSSSADDHSSGSGTDKSSGNGY